MTTVTVTRFMDDQGIASIRVPLENVEKEAILYLDDWYLLLEMNCSPVWVLINNLVLARGSLPISRLLLDAGAGEKVLHKDSNTLNLKRNNLLKAVGIGKSNTREKLLNKPFRPKGRVKIEYININPPHFNQITEQKELHT